MHVTENGGKTVKKIFLPRLCLRRKSLKAKQRTEARSGLCGREMNTICRKSLRRLLTYFRRSAKAKRRRGRTPAKTKIYRFSVQF